jgi:hypothetical protein
MSSGKLPYLQKTKEQSITWLLWELLQWRGGKQKRLVNLLLSFHHSFNVPV